MVVIQSSNSLTTTRKRSFDYNGNNDDIGIGEIRDMKRWQGKQIFSEIHQNTVKMMLEAQQQLQKRESLLQYPSEQLLDRTPIEDNYYQAPYWPVSNKSKNN